MDTKAEKKAAKREYIKKMKKIIAEMTEEQRQEMINRAMIVTCEGRMLSAKNTLLCAVQFPESTIIGGYQQWKRFGRQVKKGEKSFGIWVPTSRKTVNEDGEEEEKSGFFFGSVFDISQTEEKAA